MKFTIVAGEAMKLAMKKVGIDIGRINYQDNGNWIPSMHIHLYCRAKNETMQKYGDPVVLGHKEEYKPLNEEDIKNIKKEIEALFKQEKYSDKKWNF